MHFLAVQPLISKKRTGTQGDGLNFLKCGRCCLSPSLPGPPSLNGLIEQHQKLDWSKHKKVCGVEAYPKEQVVKVSHVSRHDTDTSDAL